MTAHHRLPPFFDILSTHDIKTLQIHSITSFFILQYQNRVCEENMTPRNPITLPLIPLVKDTVLLPGIVLRIPVTSHRLDIPALLSNVYSRAASKTPSERLDNVTIVCVPLNSPYLSPNGQKMITEGGKPRERLDINPARATKDDLFGYGVAAKISGVEGRGTGEFALLVEGVSRVRIEKLTQERPFFEAEVAYEYDEGRFWSCGDFEIGEVLRTSLTSTSYISGKRCSTRPFRTFKTAQQGITYIIAFVCIC